MLLSLIKRRWPVLTTVVAALWYVVNNYDIQGLESVRLQPRTPAVADSGLNAPFGPTTTWPGSLSPGPSLASGPGAAFGQSPAAWPVSTSGGYAADPRLSTGATAGASTNYAATAGYATLPAVVPQALSIGEKLAMLDQAQAPAAVNNANTLSSAAGVAGGVASGAARSREFIRIASFNLNGWGDSKRDNIAVSGLISRMLGQFDVIALQDIRSKQDDVLPDLVTDMNRVGRRFDFMVGPRIGRGAHREQLAFVFDTERIETDRFQLYTVDDPEDMLAREPLVGWFRTVCPAGQDAFTFSLVNVHIDPDLAQSELQALPQLVQAIVDDGRGEDDILLVGDFKASAPQLEMLAASGMRVLLDGVATTTRGSQLLDNFAFPQSSTNEYAGRSGAFDFLRQFNLSLEQAIEVSEHLPIWAEFSIIEGGRPGQVAGNALPEHRFRNGAH